MAKEKKGQKFGRGARAPSSKIYRLSKKSEINRAKRIKRHARRMAKCAIKKINWMIRKGKTTLQAQAAELQHLRYIISQNHTG